MPSSTDFNAAPIGQGLRRRALFALPAGLVAGCATPVWSRPPPQPMQMPAHMPAHMPALGRSLALEVIDRDTGGPMPVYRADGQFWVPGRPGARYGLKVRNLRGERVMLVMAVDGVNVLTGETADWLQDGYVLGPWQSGQIDGWRKNRREIAAFEFTTPPDSYAARTGRPLDIGVIGVALFGERRRDPVPPPPISRRWPQSEQESNEDRPAARRDSARASRQPGDDFSADAANSASEPAAKAESSADASGVARERAAPSGQFAPRAAPQVEQKLGTAHGRRETSVVTSTHFERARSTPDEIIAVRYDSRENLIRRGVIPAWREPAREPHPFPGGTQQGYVPDPPG